MEPEHTDTRPRGRTLRRATIALAVGVVALVTVVAAGCSGDQDPPLKLSAAGRRGATLASENGCASCHSIDGAVLVGPTWKGLWGSKVPLKGGGSVTADLAYITSSVRDPNAERRDTAAGVMPQYGPDRLSDTDLASIVAYLKELPK